MAKKGQTRKKVEKIEKIEIPAVESTIEENPSNSTDETIALTAESFKNGKLWTTDDSLVSKVKITKYSPRYPLECMTLEELMWAEKGCALICRKHETAARIDMENNKKLIEFSQYYKQILSELEKRIINICKIPE